MSSVPAISRDELRRKIEERDDFWLFEVLGDAYYHRHHLPGARHMPPGDVQGTVARANPPKDAEIVVYCWDDH